MKKSRLLGAVCAFLVVMLAGTALPVSAALVYEWVSSIGDGATGTIELNEGIGVGDIFDPLTEIAVFEFNVNSTVYGIGAFHNRSSVGWEADSLGLCAPNCIDHGIIKTKAIKKHAAGTPDIHFIAGRTEITTGVYDIFWDFRAYDGSASFNGQGDWVSVSTVPAPGALILFLSGIGMLGAVTRRFRKGGN